MSSSVPALTVSPARAAAVLATLAGLLLALMVAAPSASAAWHNQHTLHGAKVQYCKVPAAGNTFRVRVRVDNRNGKHAHTGALYRTRGGKLAQVQVRVSAGRISAVKALTVRPSDYLQSGAGEGAGIGMGDVLMLGRVARC